MATNGPVSGLMSRIFGNRQESQQAQSTQLGQQTPQMGGQQQQGFVPNMGQPAGTFPPNPLGNNPEALQSQMMTPNQGQVGQNNMTPVNQPGGQQQQQGQQQQNPQGQQQQMSPVDELSDLLNNKPNAQQAATPDFFAITPDQLQAISGRASYGNTVPTNLMQEFSQNPVETLPKILDHVTQSMMRDVVPMLAKMTQAGTSHMSSQLRQELPLSINRQQAVDSIVQKNPHMKPFADMIVGSLQQRNPGMSPAEVQAKAGQVLTNFMSSASQSFTQQQQQQNQNNPNNPFGQQNAQNGNTEVIDWDQMF